MPIDYPLQVAVWKEVGHHGRLEEIVPRIGGILRAAQSGLRALVVWRVVPGEVHQIQEFRWKSDLITSCEHSITQAPVSESASQLTSYIEHGHPAWILHSEQPPEFGASWFYREIKAPAWIAPLRPESGPPGMIALCFHKWDDTRHYREETSLASLLEPFAVAFENDWRLDQLETLKRAAEGENTRLLRRLGRGPDDEPEIIGEHGGLRSIFDRVNLVAKQDIPVLLLGETGSGKEVVARALHQRSPRHTGPFIRVNCGAISPELIDSELFGHEKGSFTGASARRRGWFEQAHHGTLFLDEVGELPAPAQVRLLRVLQEGLLTRVGGEDPQRVDVRVIAATHRNLSEMVAAHTFREDLWYRLSPFPILIPPLRDRIGDLDSLAHVFARRASIRFGVPACDLTTRDLELLQNYPWPGNVRELQSVIDRAVLLGNGTRLDIEHALGGFVGVSAPSAIRTNAASQSKIETLDQAQRRTIEHALMVTHGKIEGSDGAAKLLDIHPNTLRARMRKLNVQWRKYRRVESHDNI